MNLLKAIIILSFGMFQEVKCIGFSSNVGAACLYSTNKFGVLLFGCENNDLEYLCRCRNQHFVITVLTCIEEFSSNYLEAIEAYSYIKDTCRLNSKSHQNLYLMAENKASLNDTQYSPHALNITSQMFVESSNSVASLWRNRYLSTYFGIALIGYWSSIMLIGACLNIVSWCAPFWKMSFNGFLVGWFRRHVTLPPLLTIDDLRINSLTLNLPSRSETLIISFYYSLVVIFAAICYNFNDSDFIFESKRKRVIVYLADRLGIIAVTQLPLMFLFSCRNNVLIYITSWNYRNFNLFHKMISRIVWLMIMIHGALYASFSVLNNDFQDRWYLNKWRWATLSTICGALTILLSLQPFRRSFYELFKLSHQILGALFVVGIWQHCITLGWMSPVYLSVAILSLDHLLRWVKILINGAVVKAKCELIVSIRTTERKVEFIRVTINSSGVWRCFPGSYVYLYFLNRNMFWQSHPFTLLEPSTMENSNQFATLIKVKNGLTKKLGEYLLDKPERTLILNVLAEGPYGTPIPFRSYENTIFVAGGIGITVIYTIALDLIRNYKAEMYRKEGDRRIEIYWVTSTVETVECFANELKRISDLRFANVTIFVTRDANYVPTMNYDMVIPSKSTSDVQIVDIQQGFLKTFQKNKLESLIPLSSAAASERQLSILTSEDIFTGEVSGGQQLYKSLLSKAVDTIDSSPRSSIIERNTLSNELFNGQMPMVQLEFVKPDIEKLLKREINSTIGTLAIVTCGPDRLNRAIRNVVASSVDVPLNSRIDYFEEQLLW